MSIGLETDTEQTTAVEEPGLLSRITFEHVLYGFILAIGAITRLNNLGHLPLSPDEARQALPVWNAWQPGADSVLVMSPAYHIFTAPLTQLLGYSDAVMRLVPVLFGLAVVLLPWWLKNYTGRLGALIAALLIAVSPLFVITSRTAGGTSIALFAGLLLLVAWLNYQETGLPSWLYVFGFAVGLGLTSGALFYSILLTLLLAWIGQTVLGPALFKDTMGNRRRLKRPEQRTLKIAALIFMSTFILVSSGFLLNVGGIGASAQILAEWLKPFASPVALQDWLRPVSAFLRYELLVVILGGSALVWATWRGKAFPMLLVYWFLTALLLLFVQRGAMDNTLVLALAGILLVGSFVDSVMDAKTGLVKWIVALTVAFIGVIIYANLGRYSRLLSSEVPADVQARLYHILLIAVAVIVVVLILAILWSSERRASVQGLVIGLLILLVGFSLSTAIWLANEAANDTREPWVIRASDDDIKLLASTIRQVSWQVKGSDVDLDIYSTIDDPALAWYLRDISELQFGGGLSSSVSASGILTKFGLEQQLENEYIGIDLGYTRAKGSYPLTPTQLLAWWLFHENPNPVDEERLIFWLRSDLAGIGS